VNAPASVCGRAPRQRRMAAQAATLAMPVSAWCPLNIYRTATQLLFWHPHLPGRCGVGAEAAPGRSRPRSVREQSRGPEEGALEAPVAGGPSRDAPVRRRDRPHPRFPVKGGPGGDPLGDWRLGRWLVKAACPLSSDEGMAAFHGKARSGRCRRTQSLARRPRRRPRRVRWARGRSPTATGPSSRRGRARPPRSRGGRGRGTGVKQRRFDWVDGSHSRRAHAARPRAPETGCRVGVCPRGRGPPRPSPGRGSRCPQGIPWGLERRFHGGNDNDPSAGPRCSPLIKRAKSIELLSPAVVMLSIPGRTIAVTYLFGAPVRPSRGSEAASVSSAMPKKGN